MFITRMDLENFGPFSGERLDGFPPGLTVLHGPNEAGKSAVRAFLRMVFFGFLGKGSKDYEFYNYPPVMGGNPAGAIEVCAADGRRLRVRRTSGKTLSGIVEVTGNQRGGEDVLRDLLGRMEWELYQNVFSVSLSELQRFDTLNRDEVRDRIYSAGLGLGLVSLPSVMEKLDNERSTPQGLWSPNKGTLRVAINELSQKRRELEGARQVLSEYEDLAERRRSLQEQAETQAHKTRELRASRNRADRLLELRPHWSRRAELLRRIEALPEPGRFPQDGLARLEKLEEEERSLRQAIDDGAHKAEARQRETGQLQIVEAFQRHEPAIRELRSRAEQYAQAVRDLPEVEGELVDTERRLEEGLASLGPGWTRADLEGSAAPGAQATDAGEASSSNSASLDLSRLTDRVNSAGDRLDQARESLRHAEAEAERQDEEVRVKEAELGDITARQEAAEDAPDETAEELRETVRLLERFREAASEHRQVEQERQQSERLLVDMRSREQASSQRSSLPVSLRAMSLAAFAGAVAVLALGLSLGEGASALTGAVVLAALGAALFISDARRSEAPAGAAQDTEAQSSPAETVQAQLDEQRASLERVGREIEELMPRLGFAELPPDRAIVERMTKATRDLAARESSDKLRGDARQAGEELANARRSAQEVREAVEQAREELEAAQQGWHAVLQDAGLDPGLERGGALRAIGQIETLRERVATAASLRQRVARMRETVDSVESRLSQVLTDAGMRGFERTHAGPALEQLEEDFTRHQQDLERRKRLDRLDEEWEEERGRLEARLSEVDEERGKLLAEACVEDEQAFRTLGEQVEERRQLEREVEQIDINHPELSGSGDASIVEELEANTEEELQARREELAAEIERAEQAERETWQETRSVDDRRRALEHENPAGEIQAQIAELEERIKEQSRRWAVLTVARHLLEETRDEFQRERQAPLLQTASRHFNRFTLGRYTSVEAVIGENRMQVVDAAAGEKAKEVSELSRGTAEQLFLAMRFALIDEYARNAEPMPVLMDDVMVNFDPKRAAAVCDSVVELSESHQVIALTCHPGSVRQLQEAARRASAPDPHTVELTPAAAGA